MAKNKNGNWCRIGTDKRDGSTGVFYSFGSYRKGGWIYFIPASLPENQQRVLAVLRANETRDFEVAAGVVVSLQSKLFHHHRVGSPWVPLQRKASPAPAPTEPKYGAIVEEAKAQAKASSDAAKKSKALDAEVAELLAL